jgi:MFS transporter, UMF1 family
MTGSAPQNRFAVASWCLYDFANSPFTTLVITFIFSPFFMMSVVGDKVAGTELWSRAITISAIGISILSPILGAVADRGGYRKLFLFFFTAIATIGSAELYWVMPRVVGEGGNVVAAGQIGAAMFWVIVANIAYEMGCVFYNAFLPDISNSTNIGRISGYGWAVGYLGGLLSLFIALVGFVYPATPWFGFSREMQENIRATNLLVAVWFAIFSVPIFLWVSEVRSSPISRQGAVLKSSMRQLVTTFHEIRRYRQIVRLLLAHLIYNDGLITIFSFSGIYATGTFGFSTTEMLILAICLNIAAGSGAFAMGFMDDRLGGKRTLLFSLVGLTAAALIASLAPNKIWLWIAGILAGIFSGPNQSASRSLIGRFVPPAKMNEFYGFFALSGKATAFLGPFLFGLLTSIFATQRAGVMMVVVFFFVGGVILLSVDEKEGIRIGQEQAEPSNT